MALRKKQAQLDIVKVEEVKWSEKYVRNSSLIFRIFNLYLLLTLVNLLVFWVAGFQSNAVDQHPPDQNNIALRQRVKTTAVLKQ